jgi:hypothetical protein
MTRQALRELARDLADAPEVERPRKVTILPFPGVARRREVANAAGRQLNLSAAILALSVLADSGLEHYRGSFRNRTMYAPLGVAGLTLAGSLFGVFDRRPQRHPVRDGVYALAALVGAQALRPSKSRLAQLWLKLTAALGFAGVGFHMLGVHRGNAGWRNWRQNVLNGPPLPAPPSFTGLALAGLAALAVMREEADG